VEDLKKTITAFLATLAILVALVLLFASATGGL
jgi:hypothetical protein